MTRPKTIRINVLQKHIDQGVPCNGSLCPLSLALLEGRPRKGRHEAWTGFGMCEVRCDDEIIEEWQLSHEAERFVHAFDSHMSVKPTTFILMDIGDTDWGVILPEDGRGGRSEP